MGTEKRTWMISGILAAVLGAAYFLSRLYNITLLPIFTDEAIYIRWSQIGSRDASWRFISLVDGKQPMFTWIMMVVLRFIKDPLLAGRLVSVGAGFISIIGLWFLSYELFKSKKISFTACLVYLLVPFTLMYDRLALYDSLVSAFSIWNLYLAILLVRYVRLDVALILGLGLGAGMLNKSSGFLSLYMLPATLILFDWTKKRAFRRLLKWFGLAVIAAVLSQAMYSVLRLSPLFTMIRLKDVVFVYSLREWLTHPFNFFVGNMHGLLDWQIHYLTWPVFITALLPILIFWRQPKEKLLLYGWSIAPMVALALFGRVLYPRFILFMTMPVIVLIAVGLWDLHKIFRIRVLALAVFILIFSQCLRVDYAILTNPKTAGIPKSDKGQLIDDWPAGWGVREVNTYITEQSRNSKVTVYTDGTFGLMPYAFEIYQVDNPNVRIKGIYPMPREFPDYIEKDAASHPTYIVFNQLQTIPDWPIELVSEYSKGNYTAVKLRLFRVNLALKKK